MTKTNKLKSVLTVVAILAIMLGCFVGLGMIGANATNEAVNQQAVTVTIDTVSPSKSVTLNVDSADGYYIISNADELDAFSVLVRTNGAVYAKLTANITYNSGDLSTLEARTDGYREYMPAGMSEVMSPTYVKNYTAFVGVLDGQGNTISGLYYSKGHSSGVEGYGGVISKLGNGGVIKNLTVTKSYFADVSIMGAFAGEMVPGSLIENCHNDGTTVRGGRYVGGIVGYMSGGTVRACSNSGKIEIYRVNPDINPLRNFGGIAGYATGSSAIIELSTNSGHIIGASNVGGIAGEARERATLRNCHNTGFADGSGENYSNTFSSTVSAHIGGIVGSAYSGEIYSNLCTGKVIGYQTMGHIIGGTVTDNPYYVLNNYHCHEITVTREDEQTIWDENMVTGVEPDALTSGEVASKLGEAWGQEIGKDALPIFGGMKVYANQIGGCSEQNARYLYSNTSAETIISHDYGEPEVLSASTCATHGQHKLSCQYCDEFYMDNAPLEPSKHEQSGGFGFYACCDAIYEYVNYYENGVVKIRHPIQLLWLGRYVAKGNEDVDVILWNDLDASEIDFVPIGTPEHPYSGEFNGNGKTISGLNFTVTSGAAGLFAYTGTGTVKDLTLNGTITLNGTDSSNKIDCVGGIIGHAAGTTVTNCVSNVNISGVAVGGRAIAGIVGGADNSDTAGTVITNCVSFGSISVSQADRIVSGIVGYANQYGRVDNCANYGDITAQGAQFVAGILGYVDNSNFEGVSNCLTVGSIVGGESTAAIVGKLNSHKANTFKNNYHYSNIVGYDPSKVAIGEETFESFGLSESQMKGGMAAWGLNGGSSEGIWKQTIGTNDYPTFINTTNLKTVYAIYGCDGLEAIMGYSNTDGLTDHVCFDEQGLCTGCPEGFLPAVLHENGYYEIRNMGQLFWFSKMVNTDPDNFGSANAILMENIVINAGVMSSTTQGARSWSPIGHSGSYYKGTFDGNGMTISGLYINADGAYGSGLFGYIDGATVKNVGVINSYIFTNYTNSNGGINVGGVVAYNKGGTVRNCYYIGFVGGYNMVGGIVGQNKGTVENCMAIAEVRGTINLGFVIGTNSEGTVKNCYYYEYEYVSSIAGLGYATPSSGSSSGTASNVTKKNNVFATGEVTYLLNQTLTEGDVTWGQLLGEDEDAYPTFIRKNNAVYYGYISCISSSGKVYTNNSIAADEHLPHTFGDNGICIYCDVPNLTKEGGVYIIGSAEELVTFAAYVNSVDASAAAKLTANVTLDGNVMIGNARENAFTGTFDGNGYTITVAYNTNEEDTALFRYVNGATIQNLTLRGTITTSAKLAASFIGSTTGGTNTLNKCASYVVINSTVEGEGTHGGLVAYNESNATLNIISCLFAGEINGESTTLCSGFVGFTNGTVTVTNSLLIGEFNIVAAGAQDQTFVRSANSGNATITDCYYLNAYGTVNGGTIEITEEELKSGKVAYLLGAAWGQNFETDSSPVIGGSPVYEYTSCDGKTLLYTNNSALNGVILDEHDFANATCLAPEICTVCGETRGTTIQHSAPDANGLCQSGCGKIVVARVGEAYYVSFEEAISAAENSGETVVALADGHGVEPIPAGVVFDGGEFTFDSPEFKNYGTIAGGIFTGILENYGTVKSGTLNGEFRNYGNLINVSGDDYTLTFGENFVYKSGEGASIECNDHFGGTSSCTEQAKCQLCNQGYGTFGHDIVIDRAVAPTCTDTGLTEGSHCTRCDDATVNQETVPMIDHDWTEATQEAPKTCNSCGKTEGEPLPKEDDSSDTETSTEGSTEKTDEETSESETTESTESETVEPTEPESSEKIETEVTTESEAKKPVTETESKATNNEKEQSKSGCGSALGASSTAVLVATGFAAIGFAKKKKED